MSEYQMPAVEVGQVVWWYPDANQQTRPAAAVVTQVSGRNIDLNVLNRDRVGCDCRDGVMHLADPRAREYHAGSGAWDYTARDKELAELKKTVESLLRTVDKLLSEKAAKKAA